MEASVESFVIAAYGSSGAKGGLPFAWTALGSQYHRFPGRDYVAVAEQLVAAGAILEPRFIEYAHGPLEDWLEDRIER